MEKPLACLLKVFFSSLFSSSYSSLLFTFLFSSLLCSPPLFSSPSHVQYIQHYPMVRSKELFENPTNIQRTANDNPPTNHITPKFQRVFQRECQRELQRDVKRKSNADPITPPIEIPGHPIMCSMHYPTANIPLYPIVWSRKSNEKYNDNPPKPKLHRTCDEHL